MNETEIFDRAMTDRGGRVAWEQKTGTGAFQVYSFVNEKAKSLIADARVQCPHLPNIHFDFVYNGKVNAVAFKEGGQYFIGFNSGTVVMLQLILCRMLADPKVLTHIGDANVEATDVPLLTPLIPNAQNMVEAGATVPRAKNESRWVYSRYLFDNAVHFLLGHEIAHIALGHVDYLASKTGSSFHAEVGWNQSDDVGLMEKQALEIDADFRSVNSCIGSVRLTLMAYEDAIPPWSSSPTSAEQLLFDWAFAMNTLFRMFGDIRFAGSDLTAAAYPPFAIRRELAMRWALNGVKSYWDPALRDITLEAFHRAVRETEMAFKVITGEDISVGPWEDVASPTGREHINHLMDCLTGGLKDRLLPYAYEMSNKPPASL